MKSDIAYIYVLYDEEEPDIIRYVGKTINPKSRISSHISESKKSTSNYRLKWIRKLIDCGKKPKMKIVKICNLEDFSIYEEFYIKKYASEKLTNSDETGHGSINRKLDIIKSSIKKISRCVYCYKLNGEYIKKYNSVREASRKLELSHANISKCCNGIFKHTGGYIFKYEKCNSIEPIKYANAMKRCVVEIDIDDNILNKWVSISECSKQTNIDPGNISKCCNGKLNSIKKRYFRFL
jgi:hypothetical protein